MQNGHMKNLQAPAIYTYMYDTIHACKCTMNVFEFVQTTLLIVRIDHLYLNLMIIVTCDYSENVINRFLKNPPLPTPINLNISRYQT